MLTSSSAFHTLWRIFEEMLRDNSLLRVHLVLDGVDECGEGPLHKLLDGLLSLTVNEDGLQSKSIKLLVLSRSDDGVLSDIMTKTERLRLERCRNEIDAALKTFISRALRSDEAIRLPDEAKLQLENTLFERSEGTFLWVSFAVTTLKRLRHNLSLDRLEVLPAGLERMYLRMLQEIRPDHKAIAVKLFRWVSVSFRRLSIQELIEMLAFESVVNVGDQEEMRDLLNACGHLLQVMDNTVSFMHQSAREVLLKIGLLESWGLADYGIHHAKAHREIGAICLEYVKANIPRTDSPLAIANRAHNVDTRTARAVNGLTGSTDEDVSYISSQSAWWLQAWRCPVPSVPLLAYAAKFWPKHAREAMKHDEQFMETTDSFFMACSPTRDRWFQYCLETTPSNDLLTCYSFITNLEGRHKSNPGLEPMTLVALFGLDQLLSHYWRTFSGKPSALVLAATYSGHASTVEWLINQGADINAHDTGLDRSTPLMIALDRGNEAVASLLLSRGAEKDARNLLGMTALMFAIRSRNEAAVRALIHAGADQSARDYRGMTALSQAMNITHYGLDESGVPLHSAAGMRITQYLLDHGAVAGDRGPTGELPLSDAVLAQCSICTQLLWNRMSGEARQSFLTATRQYWADCPESLASATFEDIMMLEGAVTRIRAVRRKTARQREHAACTQRYHQAQVAGAREAITL